MSSILDYRHSECLFQELSLINQHHKEWEDKIIQEREDYNLFSLLRPRVFIDGNQWCVLYGKDIQSGVAGFGNTIKEATLNFNYQFSVAAQEKEEPEGIGPSEICPKCNGRGSCDKSRNGNLEYGTCDKCGGSGKLPPC